MSTQTIKDLLVKLDSLSHIASNLKDKEIDLSKVSNSSSITILDGDDIKEPTYINSSRLAINSASKSSFDVTLPNFVNSLNLETQINAGTDSTIVNIDNNDVTLSNVAYYGVTSLNKDIHAINNIYTMFPYYNSIFEKVRTKLSKKLVLPISSTPKSLNFIISLNNGIKDFLKHSGFNGLHDLYTNIYMDQVRYGISYVHFDRQANRISTLNQSNLMCIYEKDIHKKYPKLYIQYQDYNVTPSILQNYGSRMGFYLGNEIFKLEQVEQHLKSTGKTVKSELEQGLNVCKIIPEEDVFTYTDSNMYKDSDLFVESPIIDNQRLIYDYNRLYAIKMKTQREQYGNIHIISLKDSLGSVKATKDFSIDVANVLTNAYSKQLAEFNMKLKTISIGKNTFLTSPLISGVHTFDKQIENRTFMISELGVDASNIMVKHGIPPKILDIQKAGAEGGKRNEDVQHIEIQEFIAGIANSYNNLLLEIANHVIEHDGLNSEGVSMFYLKEMDFLTVDGYSKVTVSNSLSGKYLSPDELRLLSGFGSGDVGESLDISSLEISSDIELHNQIELAKLNPSNTGTFSSTKTKSSSTSGEAKKEVQKRVNKSNQNGTNNTSATPKREN